MRPESVNKALTRATAIEIDGIVYPYVFNPSERKEVARNTV